MKNPASTKEKAKVKLKTFFDFFKNNIRDKTISEKNKINNRIAEMFRWFPKITPEMKAQAI
jgi:hypothetical protein